MRSPRATDAKRIAAARLQEARPSLVELSHRIHANPELGFHEEKAASWIAEVLGQYGLRVERGVGGLPTALAAHSGDGELNIALCAEYDALPDVGHACGHNLIAAMAIGAGIALASVAGRVGLHVTVVGTPAEEGGGGKILLLERGVFQGVHAAMMIHPGALDVLAPTSLALSSLIVEYTGKSSHASASPEMGVNAADSMAVAQHAIALLRQQLRPTARVHGIVTNGGTAPNIIPGFTAARYMVRARTMDELAEIKAKIRLCFEAGAVATGATLALIPAGPDYAPLRHDEEMSAIYRRNAAALGRTFIEDVQEMERSAASTDMGNISQAIPSIQPIIAIGSLPAVPHQPEFAEKSIAGTADQAIMDGALLMALTAIDLANTHGARSRLLAGAAETTTT